MLMFSENFRGTPNGWHEIADANFLVGENSTGKSSLGMLVQIVCSQDFNIGSMPTDAVPGLDVFYDFWSKLSGDLDENSIFTIGFLNRLKKNEHIFGKLVSFGHDDGKIIIDRISIFENNNLVKLFFTENQLERCKSAYSTRSNLSRLKKQFLEFHNHKASQCEVVLEMSKKDRPPGFVLNILLHQKIEELKEGKSFSISNSHFSGRRSVHAFGPIRSKPERVHYVNYVEFDSEGKWTTIKLKDSLKNNSFYRALKRFGKASGLYEDVKVDDITKYVGKQAFVIKFTKSGKEFFADELGFGLSQVMPLIIDTISPIRDSLLIIQQPELHLHPRAQAAFGDVLFEYVKGERKFIIETHSDFLIDRFRVNIANSRRKQKPKSQVIFFLSSRNGNESKNIPIDENGSFIKTPVAYRNFFLREQMRVFDAL